MTFLKSHTSSLSGNVGAKYSSLTAWEALFTDYVLVRENTAKGYKLSEQMQISKYHFTFKWKFPILLTFNG